MSQIDRIYEKRYYEGEWAFECENRCGGYVVEYAFDDWDKTAEAFLDSRIGGHAWSRCQQCKGILQWVGCSGDRPISKSVVSLAQNGHYMAATVMLASITESFINALVYAVLADRGLSRDDANRIANSSLGRQEALKICRQLTGWTIPDLAFSIRNIVAHGRGFGREERLYKDEVKKQADAIRAWVEKLYKAGNPKWFSPNETDRWLLFMNHWSQWLVSFVNRSGAAAVAEESSKQV